VINFNEDLSRMSGTKQEPHQWHVGRPSLSQKRCTSSQWRARTYKTVGRVL